MVPWNAEERYEFIKMQFNAQQSHYQTHYPEADHDIIIQSGRPIGRLYVARLENEIRLLDITLLGQYRNQEIGSQLMLDLWQEAKAAKLPMRFYVAKGNRAVIFYQRLGFKITRDEEVYIFMEQDPKGNSKKHRKDRYE